MAEINTGVKLKVAKEILANVFIDATTANAAEGIMYKYKSQPIETEEMKGWSFQFIICEAGYPERILQEIKFQRPANIDAKNMEYHVVIAILSTVLQTTMLSWDQLGKMMNTDLLMQHAAKESLK